MKKSIKYIILLAFVLLFINPQSIFAGNKDRAGEAGASELLINPWARSSGWGGVDVSCARGLESMFINVAGIAFTKQTEIIFANTNWLKGADINVNSFGFTQKLSETGVLGIYVMSMDFGESKRTTELMPEGGLGNFSPKYMNINIAYSKMFSNSIYGGVNLKIISESNSDMAAQGIALDAGIQYVTGDREHIKFGVSIKNLGPQITPDGTGRYFTGFAPESKSESTNSFNVASFELPSCLMLGFAYDIEVAEIHKITLAGSFVSNSFVKDLLVAGVEYNFNEYLYLRASYTWEDGVAEYETSSTALSGPSAGFSVDVPFTKEKDKKFSFDYSYRLTQVYFGGTHTVGARISI